MSIRLFIADTDANHILNVTRVVSRCPDLQIVGTCENGAHVLRQLAITPVDVLITEVQLPGLDGIMLLRDLQTLRNPPAVIVCTHFYSPLCVSKACASGASFFMYKPLDYNRLAGIIRECHRVHLQSATDARFFQRDATPQSKAQVIHSLLAEAGIPANLTGSMYLSEALLVASENPTLIRNLSKGLYAEVAARTQSTPARLERALRNAISIACERGGLAQHFGHCPTNRECLIYLLEQLQLRISS